MTRRNDRYGMEKQNPAFAGLDMSGVSDGRHSSGIGLGMFQPPPMNTSTEDI